MNLYEALYSRRSVRTFLQEPVDHKIIEEMFAFFEDVIPLFADIQVKLEVVDCVTESEKISGPFHVKAPYYLAFYSEHKEKYLLNAGYLMQQVSLFLFSKGIGSCYLGGAKRKKDKRQDGLEFVILMAFGKPEGTFKRPEREAKRLSLDELCVYKEQPRSWMYQILGAARLAPSSMNTQPWRFVVYDKRVHIFTKKSKLPVAVMQRWNEFDFGIMLSHIMIVAEEIWVDVDLIKLDNITHKTIPNNQYVISAILKP